MRHLGLHYVILISRQALRFGHVNRLTFLRQRQFKRRDGNFRLLVIDRLLLRDVGARRRRLISVQVTARVHRVNVLGPVTHDGLLRRVMFKCGRDKRRLTLINGRRGLISRAIRSRLQFSNLEHSMFPVKDLRRVLSAVNRRRFAILRMTNVTHVRPAVNVGNLRHNLFFFVVALNGNLSARWGLAILAGLRFRSICSATCEASYTQRVVAIATRHDDQFHRAVANRRISTRNVGRLFRNE